jgi:uncharacterized protein
MEFLVLSRAAARAGDDALNEAHWSYMDRFAASMIARGPTLAPDRETWTGSLHVLGLPDLDAAQRFVADEPYNRAGLYEEHSIWVFDNLLGRTMWEFSGLDADEPRFLVIALGDSIERVPVDRLILYGTLRAVPNGPPIGSALAIQAPTAAAARETVTAPGQVEVYDWEFGGRG